MSREHRQIGAAVLFGATILSSAACARHPAEPGPPAQATSAPDAAPSLDPRTRGWELGNWYAYALKLTSEVSFGDGRPAIDFELDGLLQITPATTTPEVVTLYLALADPKIVSRDPHGQAAFDKVAAQIGGTGVFLTLSGGRTTEMFAPRGLSATAANTYREIGSALQFARTAPAVNSYTADEFDTTGQYVAAYEQDRDLAYWHKRKQRYLGLLAAKDAPPNAPGRVVPQVDESEGDVRLLADGRPESIVLRDKVTISGAQQPVHSVTSLSLQTRRSDVAQQPAPDWSALLSAMKRTGADEPYGEPATIESLDQARIHGMNFEQVLASLEDLAKTKGGSVVSSVNGASLAADEQARRERRTADESRLFVALAAIFRQEPATIAKAVQKIKAKSPASDVLVEALSTASSPAAQSALIGLAASKALTPEQRNRLLMALSRTPTPDARSIDLMKDTLRGDPFNEIALLGLGTYSRRLRDSGKTEQASAIGRLLVERLVAAQKTMDRMTALRAITNAGYAPALAQVSPYLVSDQDDIRVAAIRALQSMKDPMVDGILAERLKSDASSDVRLSALSAAKVREPSDTLANAVENVATGASDPQVRYHAVDLLAAWMPRRPDVRSTLEQVAKSDAEMRIRERAQSSL